MAFNIIAESKGKMDYDSIHSALFKQNLPFDFFPMPAKGLNGGDAIGICVPLKNCSDETWEILKPILKSLKSKFNCDVYDLYGGQKLGLLNINSFRQNMVGGK